MNNKRRMVTLTLILTFSFVCVTGAMGALMIREPFSARVKKAELIFVGTVVEKDIIHEGTTGLQTDLTFHVDKLIEGEPNIDAETVKFRVPGQFDELGRGYLELEVGDTLLMLMHVNKRVAIGYGGLYPISNSCWFVKSKEVDAETEYTVYIWASRKAELDRHFIGMPLPLMMRFIDAARKHPESIDPITDVVGNALMKSYEGIEGIDTPEAARIRHGILTYIALALEDLETEDTQKTRIAVQRLAGATPDVADQLLKQMLPCELRHENRWQAGQSDDRDIMGKLFNRVYEIENGQVDRWQRKPGITLFFDPDYEERVNQVMVSYIEFVSHSDALERLGYDLDAAIAHPTSTHAWCFITSEYLHQVYWEDTGQSTTGVTIYLDALTIVD